MGKAGAPGGYTGESLTVGGRPSAQGPQERPFRPATHCAQETSQSQRLVLEDRVRLVYAVRER